ncbi:hypothetical protein KKE06_03740 [Candidatus Micrarchaeota archaeon]|nr:hypothetical protein [Candidatus Micrarchaeota archaeon]
MIKKSQNQKGFVFTTEAIIGLAAAIMIITTVTLLVENPSAQIESTGWKHSQTIMEAQTHLVSGTLKDESEPGSNDYYCYKLYHLGLYEVDPETGPIGSPPAVESRQHCCPSATCEVFS